MDDIVWKRLNWYMYNGRHLLLLVLSAIAAIGYIIDPLWVVV